MTTYYKLADVGDRTMRGTQWGVGVTHAATGDPAQGLHSDAYIHAYEHPLLAVFHDPIGNNFGSAAHLWEAESDDDEPVREGPISLGVRSLTTLRQIPLPQITTEQRVRYAILCGKAVYTAEEWVTWADNWLSGADRSRNSIDRAVAGIAGARPIALRLLSAAGFAGDTATYAAFSATYATNAADAADAGNAPKAAADAGDAANAAAHAAEHARRHADINLITIAMEAVSPMSPTLLPQANSSGRHTTKEILTARYLHDMSYADIAQTLGTTVGNVRVRCLRAREALRAALSAASAHEVS